MGERTAGFPRTPAVLLWNSSKRVKAIMRWMISALLLMMILVLVPIGFTQQLQIKLVSLTSPASPGDNASITIQTVPNAACMITVRYKSGPSRARGLNPRNADHEGTVTWTWRVGTRTTPGRWPIIISCSVGSRESTLETSFVVR